MMCNKMYWHLNNMSCTMLLIKCWLKNLFYLFCRTSSTYGRVSELTGLDEALWRLFISVWYWSKSIELCISLILVQAIILESGCRNFPLLADRHHVIVHETKPKTTSKNDNPSSGSIHRIYPSALPWIKVTPRSEEECVLQLLCCSRFFPGWQKEILLE